MELKNPLKGKSRTVQTLVVIGIILLLVGIVYAVTIAYNIPTSGDIQTVSLNTPTNIDWGIVNNGTLTTQTIQVQNTGNQPCTLSLSTASLSSSIKGLTLSWDYTAGTILSPSETISIELRQTITATGAWNYNTIITATQS